MDEDDAASAALQRAENNPARVERCFVRISGADDVVADELACGVQMEGNQRFGRIGADEQLGKSDHIFLRSEDRSLLQFLLQRTRDKLAY